MSDVSRSLTAADALLAADVIVAKIGGDNAGSFRATYETIAGRLQRGVKQILVVSAIRSSSAIYDSFSDPKVVDRSADGSIKHGFNTTSHLIRIAKLLNRHDRESRTKAGQICQQIAEFTRMAIRKDLESPEDREVIKALEAVVQHEIDETESTSSLRNLIGPPTHGIVEREGEDWQLVTQKRTNQGWEYDDKRSITGIGEELAQALYTRYFRLKGVNAGQLNIYSDEMRKIARNKPHAVIDAKHLREDIVLQLQRLFMDCDIVIAGGYLPNIGSQRGYSDKTGALIAQAATKIGLGRVTYIIEKAMPIMSGDPLRIESARVVGRISYFLAKELFGNTHGANGAAVHPKAVEWLGEDAIPIVVHNPRDAAANATLIDDYAPKPNGVEIVAARKVPVAIEIRCTQMIGEPGFLAAVTAFFAEQQISIDQVATSEGSISLTFTENINEEVFGNLRHMLCWKFGERVDIDREHEQVQIEVLRNKSLIFCLGNNMKTPGIASKATLALQLVGADVHLITQGLNECVMTFMIDDEKVSDALSLLHDFCIILPEEDSTNLMKEMRTKMLSLLRSAKDEQGTSP